MDKCSQIEMHRKENSMRRCGPIISALNSLRPPEIWVQATQRYCNGLQEIIHAKESRFRNMGNFLLVESGTVGFEIQNSAQGTPESHWRHWRRRPESKFHWQRTGIIGNRNQLEGIFLPFLSFTRPLSGGIFCCFSYLSRYVATLQRVERGLGLILIFAK